MSTVKVKYECPSCGGSGLYCGFMEGPGQAVVCVNCEGTGQAVTEFKPFTGRKKKRGVKQIRFGSGLIFDDAGKAKWFTYKEFESLVKAPKK